MVQQISFFCKNGLPNINWRQKVKSAKRKKKRVMSIKHQFDILPYQITLHILRNYLICYIIPVTESKDGANTGVLQIPRCFEICSHPFQKFPIRDVYGVFKTDKYRKVFQLYQNLEIYVTRFDVFPRSLLNIYYNPFNEKVSFCKILTLVEFSKIILCKKYPVFEYVNDRLIMKPILGEDQKNIVTKYINRFKVSEIVLYTVNKNTLLYNKTMRYYELEMIEEINKFLPKDEKLEHHSPPGRFYDTVVVISTEHPELRIKTDCVPFKTICKNYML